MSPEKKGQQPPLPDLQFTTEDELQSTMSWDNISYHTSHALYKDWVQSEPDPILRRKKRRVFPLPDGLITTTPEATAFLAALEDTLESTYQLFGVQPESLYSYEKYGRRQRVENYRSDPIQFIIDRVRNIADVQNMTLCTVTTVVGEGYPREWKLAFPESEVSAFDINPIQHVRWGHTIQSPQGAVAGYLVDGGVATWMKALLDKTNPDVLYLSNIVTFLQENISQVEALAASLQAKLPPMIICSNPFAAPGNSYFKDMLTDQYACFKFVVPNSSGLYGAHIYLKTT